MSNNLYIFIFYIFILLSGLFRVSVRIGLHACMLKSHTTFLIVSTAAAPLFTLCPSTLPKRPSLLWLVSFHRLEQAPLNHVYSPAPPVLLHPTVQLWYPTLQKSWWLVWGHSFCIRAVFWYANSVYIACNPASSSEPVNVILYSLGHLNHLKSAFIH